MATTLWTRENADVAGWSPPTITGYSGHPMLPSEGSQFLAVNKSATCTASGNHIEFSGHGDGVAGIFLYRVNAVTISGSITIHVHGSESAMTTNAQAAVRIVRVNNSGSILSDVVADANANHAFGTEMGTADSAGYDWSITPTSTSFSDGDWIGVIWHADAFGTMGSGSATSTYSGTHANVRDDKVTFTETITAYTPATYSGRPDRQMPQLLAH